MATNEIIKRGIRHDLYPCFQCCARCIFFQFEFSTLPPYTFEIPPFISTLLCMGLCWRLCFRMCMGVYVITRNAYEKTHNNYPAAAISIREPTTTLR